MKELVHTQQQILDNFLKDDHRSHTQLLLLLPELLLNYQRHSF